MHMLFVCFSRRDFANYLVDFQLFPSPFFDTPPEGSHPPNWVERQDSNTQPTELQEDPADSWMTDATSWHLINGEKSPIPITETSASEERPAGGENPAVKETRKDEEPEPDIAFSYPTPMSNLSDAPNLANKGLERPYKLLRPKPAHTELSSSTISRPISFENASANQVGIH